MIAGAGLMAGPNPPSMTSDRFRGAQGQGLTSVSVIGNAMRVRRHAL
jgi:hypothetical protein